MVLKTKDIKKALKKKGFEEDKSSHHNYYYFNYNGLRSHINTRISHGASEIDGWLINAMARQVNLSKNQFVDFVDCVFTQKKYEESLIKDGHIKANDGNGLNPIDIN